MSACRKSLFDSCPAGSRKREETRNNFWCFSSVKNESQSRLGSSLLTLRPCSSKAIIDFRCSQLQVLSCAVTTLFRCKPTPCDESGVHSSHTSSVVLCPQEEVRHAQGYRNRSEKANAIYQCIMLWPIKTVISKSSSVVVVERSSQRASLVGFATFGGSSRRRCRMKKGKTMLRRDGKVGLRTNADDRLPPGRWATGTTRVAISAAVATTSAAVTSTAVRCSTAAAAIVCFGQ